MALKISYVIYKELPGTLHLAIVFSWSEIGVQLLWKATLPNYATKLITDTPAQFVSRKS